MTSVRELPNDVLDQFAKGFRRLINAQVSVVRAFATEQIDQGLLGTPGQLSLVEPTTPISREENIAELTKMILNRIVEKEVK
jgi:hypothetical protein